MHASQASVNTVRVSRSCRQRTPLREPAGRAAAMEPVREQVAGRGTRRPAGVEGRGGAKGRGRGAGWARGAAGVRGRGGGARGEALFFSVSLKRLPLTQGAFPLAEGGAQARPKTPTSPS